MSESAGSVGTEIVDSPIVDSHLHLWDIGRNHYPWLAPDAPSTNLLGDVSAIRRNFLVSDYLSDAQPFRIAKAVHVQADHDPADPVRETRWLQEIANRCGIPQAIVVPAVLEDPDVSEAMDEHRAYPNVRGVRQSLNWIADPTKQAKTIPDRLSDPAWKEGFRLLRDRGLSFDLQVYPSQMAGAAKLAAEFPDTVIILNHLGMPVDHSDLAMDEWRKGMQILASQENVALKVSGLGMIVRAWTPGELRSAILTAIDLFGVDRSMFGSNYPVENLSGTLSRAIEFVAAVTSDLTSSERRKFFCDNAERYYRMQIHSKGTIE